MIDEAGGLVKIEHLQGHDNGDIYEKAVKILENYRPEEDDETMASGDAAQSRCHFGNNEQISVPSGGFNFRGRRLCKKGSHLELQKDNAAALVMGKSLVNWIVTLGTLSSCSWSSLLNIAL
ncbi:importin subunit alpha-1b isoform X2 [Elaeis guineensis]|uniref:importin subunit alpha-1b isoform X2 n=1 Tax=Elaeis guineensis var. tenera TaxID=51953 RepID=UPI003C6D5641